MRILIRNLHCSSIGLNKSCLIHFKKKKKKKRKAMTNLDRILESRDITLPTKVHIVKTGFSSSHVWMWELNHRESWVPKKWYFQTVVLEKTLESLLDNKETKLINPKGNQPWIFTGRTDAEAPILWPPDVKNYLTLWKRTLVLAKI